VIFRLALIDPVVTRYHDPFLVTGLFDHGEGVEELGFWEEVVEPELVEGQEAGGI
jgi:hypothetical protein